MTKDFKLTIKTEEEMVSLGTKIGKKLSANDILTLNGDLGAGKTTLTKGIGLALGVKRIINSPTFTILKRYEGNLTLYHIDAYRIDKNSGDDSLEEYFEMGGVTVIEWAKNILYLLPLEYIEIKIEMLENNYREVSFLSNNKRTKQIIEELR